MSTRANPLFPVGTKIVTMRDVRAQDGRTLHPRGAVGVIVKAPESVDAACQVRFPDGFIETIQCAEITTLAKFNDANESVVDLHRDDLFDRVIFQCVIGSQAYGLADQQSDVDRKGIYLPPANRHWSLYGVPEQLECHETQEHYWELQKFLVLALKANPNVLECLYSPLVEKATPLAQELIDMRQIFLSQLVYQTFNGYAMSQFKKMQADIRNHGKVKWKHVMHLLRLLIAGKHTLMEGIVLVTVDEKHKEKLLSVKRGEMSWDDANTWRKQLHQEFDQAFKTCSLPERPDYEAASQFLIKARQAAMAQDLP